MADSMKRKPHAGNWKPGQSGNPSGRPKIVGEIQDLARKATTLAIETLTRIASDRKAPPAAQVAAAVALLDRGYGRPGQAVDLNVNRKTHDEMTDAELSRSPQPKTQSRPHMMKIKARLLDSVCVVSEDGRKANLDSVLKRGFPLCSSYPSGRDNWPSSPPAPPSATTSTSSRTGQERSGPSTEPMTLCSTRTSSQTGSLRSTRCQAWPSMSRRPHKKTTFYIASTCDPSVFDALEGHKVQVFHAAGMDYPHGNGRSAAEPQQPRGSAIWPLLQGWRDIVMYGVDSSYEGREYCYEWGTYSTDIAERKSGSRSTGKAPLSRPRSA